MGQVNDWMNDGGNSDPTTTHGKTPAEAKALELAGWSYPRHLAGRVFPIVVHSDTDGAEPAEAVHLARDGQLPRPDRRRREPRPK